VFKINRKKKGFAAQTRTRVATMDAGTTSMATKLEKTTGRVAVIPLIVMIMEETNRMVVIGVIMTAVVDEGGHALPDMDVMTMTIIVEGAQVRLEDLDMEVSLSFREGDMVPTYPMFRSSFNKTSTANSLTG